MKPLVAELQEFKRREMVEQPGAALKAVLPVDFVVVGPGVIVGDEDKTEGLALVVPNEEVAVVLALVETVFPRTLPALEQNPPNAEITE